MLGSQTPSTADLVASYSQSFNDTILTEHGVASALGLWVLLALLAPGSQESDRDELEKALGTSADDAASRAAELLANPHPALHAAVALWSKAAALNEKFAAFAESLPAEITRGAVPTQEQADTWANEHTLGLISQFPLHLDPLIAAVLVSAIATKGEWLQPFDGAKASDLGGVFAAQADTVLRSPDTHKVAIVRTMSAGLVGVHSAHTTEGLLVISVIGAPYSSPPQMHGAALEVSRLLSGVVTTAQYVNLFDLELGDGLAWHIEEREYLGAGFARQEYYEAFLAAWEMRSEHSLKACPGVIQSANTLDGWLKEEERPGTFGAEQVAMARFTKVGFEAAAITAVSGLSAPMPQANPITERTATIFFNRPYAVLALTDTRAPNPDAPWLTDTIAPDVWLGVPAFAAWVGRVNPA